MLLVSSVGQAAELDQQEVYSELVFLISAHRVADKYAAVYSKAVRVSPNGHPNEEFINSLDDDVCFFFISVRKELLYASS